MILRGYFSCACKYGSHAQTSPPAVAAAAAGTAAALAGAFPAWPFLGAFLLGALPVEKQLKQPAPGTLSSPSSAALLLRPFVAEVGVAAVAGGIPFVSSTGLSALPKQMHIIYHIQPSPNP